MRPRAPRTSRGARRMGVARARAGSAYVMVLACSALVTTITLGGLLLNRAQRQAYQSQEDVRRARMAAASALEASTQVLSPTFAGRSVIGITDRLPVAVDGVAIEYGIVDPIDANLTNDITQPVDVTVEARIGAARQLLAGTLTPRLVPIGMASYAIAASQGVKFYTTTVDARGGVYAGSGVESVGARVAAPVFSPGNMTGDTYLSTRRTVARASGFDADDLAHLIDSATTISYNALSDGDIDRALLSPSINPFGAATNPKGVYLIDCGGESLSIRDTRILGTLIVLNAGSESEWTGSNNIASFDPNLPAIVWIGDLEVSTSAADLTETGGGVSLNPPGAPYLGQTDTDMLDKFPSLITGTALVVGNMEVIGALSVDGRLMVMGTIIANNATLRVRDNPDGTVPSCLFEAEGFELVPGTVRREVDAP